MRIINKNIDEYASSFTSPEPLILQELSRETHVKHLFPRMLSGHHQGRFLSIISKIFCPSRVLEVGTYTGYSAICLAEGLAENGVVHTIESNHENEEIIRRYILKTGNQDRIIPHFGDALEIIPTLDFSFDLVFLDADKEHYIEYFEMFFDKVVSGGIILADNVLWNGKVLDDSKNDKESLGIRKFNDFVKDHRRIEHVLITIRDGIMIIRKK